jgi:hypothetical protein
MSHLKIQNPLCEFFLFVRNQYISFFACEPLVRFAFAVLNSESAQAARAALNQTFE